MKVKAKRVEWTIVSEVEYYANFGVYRLFDINKQFKQYELHCRVFNTIYCFDNLKQAKLKAQEILQSIVEEIVE